MACYRLSQMLDHANPRDLNQSELDALEALIDAEPPAQPSGSLREGFAFQHHVLLTSAFRAAIGVEETGDANRDERLLHAA